MLEPVGGTSIPDGGDLARLEARVTALEGQMKTAALAAAAGMWKDRDDLPDFEALRGEWDRERIMRDPQEDTARIEHARDINDEIEQLREDVEQLDTLDEALEARDTAYARLAKQRNAEIKQLKAEITVSDKILAEQGRIFAALECPIHGDCIPHAIEQIAAMREALKAADGLRATHDGEEEGCGCRICAAVHTYDTARAKVKEPLC